MFLCYGDRKTTGRIVALPVVRLLPFVDHSVIDEVACQTIISKVTFPPNENTINHRKRTLHILEKCYFYTIIDLEKCNKIEIITLEKCILFTIYACV